MIQAIYGLKQNQKQLFLENGARVPVTVILAKPMPVVQVKTVVKEGYNSLQVGVGSRKDKNLSKARIEHVKNSKIDYSPFYLREIRVEDVIENIETGSLIDPKEILKQGDIVKVTGVSKGKGFASGIKRYNFKGGPRTHGQSDRERAPGSVGQTTTPGRVYKGKRMAGRMGQDTTTIKNVTVLAVNGDEIYLSGLFPGGRNSLLYIQKMGERKNFVPLLAGTIDSSSVEEKSEAKEGSSPIVNDQAKVGENKEETNGN